MADPIQLDPKGQARVTPTTQANRQSQKGSAAPGGSSFAETLSQAQNIKFSNHAQKRLQTRDISLSDDGLARLALAVEKADKRGGRESLVVMDDLAFIVNVKERLVVTALDSQSRGEGVFTQIDSVVFAEKSNGEANSQEGA